MEVNTGAAGMGTEEWVSRVRDRERLSDDTERFADILAEQGVQSRLPVELAAVGLVTGKVQLVEALRNTNVLPLVASRNRSAMARTLEFFIENHPQGRWLRYGVFTFGKRLEVFADLRGRVQEKHRALSKLAHWAKNKYGIHFVYRHGETAIDENLSIHAHTNVLYYVTHVLSKERWAQFKWEAAQKFGARWEDNGRIKNAKEIVKYFVKGDDLSFLADMACAVPEWADREFDVMAAAEEVARRLAAKAARDSRRHEDPMAYLGAGLAHVQRLAADLRERAAAGAPHPFVWLFQEMFGLRIATPMGEFRLFRAAMRSNREKVVRVGKKLRKTEIEKRDNGERPCEMAGKVEAGQVCPMRHLCSGCPLDRREAFDVLVRENEVLAVTLPQARFTPWAEPVALVRNFRARPATMLGALHLDRMDGVGRFYRRYWDKAGAPDPRLALSQVALAADGGGGPPPPAGEEPPEAALYGSHYYDNCLGDRMPYATREGDLVERETGEVILEARSPFAAVLDDWMDPRTWGLDVETRPSVVVDEWKAHSVRHRTKQTRELSLETLNRLLDWEDLFS